MNIKIDNYLLKKYAAGSCTQEEEQAVEQWLEDTASDETEMLADTAEDISKVWSRIATGIRGKRTRTLWPRYAVAASFLIAVFSAVLYLVDIRPMNAAKPDGLVQLSRRDRYEIKIDLNKWKNGKTNRMLLVNNTHLPKRIRFNNGGASSFIVKPRKVYFLEGNYERPIIVEKI